MTKTSATGEAADLAASLPADQRSSGTWAAGFRVVSLLVFISGMCALVFQTAWLRELKLVFGGSTPAAAAVVAIFMGGLGLGNAVFGPRADESHLPLRLYALLEIGVSLFSMLSPLLV